MTGRPCIQLHGVAKSRHNLATEHTLASEDPGSQWGTSIVSYCLASDLPSPPSRVLSVSLHCSPVMSFSPSLTHMGKGCPCRACQAPGPGCCPHRPLFPHHTHFTPATPSRLPPAPTQLCSLEPQCLGCTRPLPPRSWQIHTHLSVSTPQHPPL